MAAARKTKKKSVKPGTTTKNKSRQHKSRVKMPTSIAPWLCVRGGARAVEFYKSAFGATEAFRIGDDDSTVARLSIDGAEFWLSDESPEHFNFSPESLGGITTRIILTVADPDALFARAIKAGAKEVYAMTEENEWRVGRVVDPFGQHWEIGRPLG